MSKYDAFIISFVAISLIFATFTYTNDLSFDNAIGEAYLSKTSITPQFQIKSMPGWPKYSGSGLESGFGDGAVFDDINNDGKNEIITGSMDGKIYVWNIDGSLMKGWPYTTKSYVGFAPAVADVNKDGYKEIAMISNDGKTYLLNRFGQNMPGWPKTTGQYYVHSSGPELEIPPIIADINNDGYLEILVLDNYYDDSLGRQIFKIYIFNYDGTNYGNSPIDIQASLFNMVVADLNNDNNKEIIAYGRSESDMETYIYVWDKEMNYLPGWPITIETSWDEIRFMAVGDIDGDGYKDIIANGFQRIHALNKNAKYLPGWPITSPELPGYDVVLADIDNDKLPEVIFTAGGNLKLYVADENGIIKKGFPVLIDKSNKISVADINNDGRNEIITGSGNSKNVYAVDYNGKIVSWFILPSNSQIDFTPLIGDIDKDGNLEVAFGEFGYGNNYFYVYKIVGARPGLMPWPTAMHDNYHSATYK
jgi:hypothetical protein